MKNHKKLVLLLFSVLTLATFFVEGVSWYVMKNIVHQPMMYAPDAAASFSLVPNFQAYHSSPEYSVTYVINSQGFRGPPVELPKPKLRKHVLVLGDSFVFGWGVDEEFTVTHQLEALYSQNNQPEVRVINGGFMAGKSPDDAYAFLSSSRGKAFAPDVIIEMIFIKNDFRDVAEHSWISRNSDGLPLVVRSSEDFPNDQNGRGPIPFYKSNSILSRISTIQLVMRAYFGLVELPRRSRQIRNLEDELIETHGGVSKRFERLLLGLKKLSHAMNSCYLMAIIETSNQVNGVPDEPYDSLLKKVKSFSLDHAIPFVVLGADTGFEKGDYYRRDGHWRPSGHYKAARATYDALSTAGCR